jgi:hypothetical protein
LDKFYQITTKSATGTFPQKFLDLNTLKKSFSLEKCDVLMPCPAEVVMIFRIIVNPGWPSAKS